MKGGGRYVTALTCFQWEGVYVKFLLPLAVRVGMYCAAVRTHAQTDLMVLHKILYKMI